MDDVIYFVRSKCPESSGSLKQINGAMELNDSLSDAWLLKGKLDCNSLKPAWQLVRENPGNGI
jgi:hypothetical protein